MKTVWSLAASTPPALAGAGVGAFSPPVQPAKTLETSRLGGGRDVDVADEHELQGIGAIVFGVKRLHVFEGGLFGAREDFGARGLAVGMTGGIDRAGEGIGGAELGVLELALVEAGELLLQLLKFLGENAGVRSCSAMSRAPWAGPCAGTCH
jgi:hypothetical protein